MANTKSGFNAVGQASGPRSNTQVSPSHVLEGAARSAHGANGTGHRIPSATPSVNGQKPRPGGPQSVRSRKGTANISRPGR